VSVPAGQGLTVLGNAPVKGTSTFNGRMTVEFEQFPQVMTTYTTAFAIGRFDYVEGKTSDGILLRVYTPQGYSQYGQYALNISIQFLGFYAQKLGFPYSAMTSKLDQISVPGIDYDAMENWGLATYSPDFLLVDPSSNDRNQLQMISQVTSHEIFHMWFGNTITCPWWNDEYLQEGFARLYEYIATDWLFPQWYVWTTPDDTVVGNTEFYSFVFNNAMSNDYMGTAPPIIVPYDDASEAESIIFYAKGASVNYMIRQWMGDDQWLKGLNYHLTHHLWSNPNENDLMNSFAAVGWPIGPLWMPWLTQSGFPVVTLDIDDTTNLVTATQRPIASTLPQNQLWWILLNVMATNSANPMQNQTFLMNFSGKSATYQLPTGVDWNLYANYNYTAFIVANYDQQDQWDAVLNQLTNPNFPLVDQQLLEEALFYLGNAP
jgi:puromycin-sensitive aminopeptidase